MAQGDEWIGRYRVVGWLGEGGMGAVARAHDPDNGRDVAIKLVHNSLLANVQVMERFERERRVLLELSTHPNIVTMLDFVPDPVAMVMELLEGETLAEVLEREGGLAPERVLRLLRAVLEAVGYAHERGITHRDLKPGNVMVVRLGSQEQVKVMDFGLAGFTEGRSGLTRTNARMGTPDYMAPEQHLGRTVGAAADIYAVGVMLFEMLTGLRPFAHAQSDYELMQAHIEHALPAVSGERPGLPATLDAVVARATAKDPAARYPSCGAMLRALEAAVSSTSAAPNPLAPTLAPHRPPAAPTILENPAAEAAPPPPAPPPAAGASAPPPATGASAPPPDPAPPSPPPLDLESPQAGVGLRRAAPIAALALLLASVAAWGVIRGTGADGAEGEAAGAEEAPSGEGAADAPPASAGPGAAASRAAETKPPAVADPETAANAAGQARTPSPAPTTPPVPTPTPRLGPTEPLSIARATASSVAKPIRSKRITYDASRALDGRTDTWWQEGESGDGVGETLRVYLDQPAYITRLRLVPGYMKESNDRYGDRWKLNNRLARVVVRVGRGAQIEASKEVHLADSKGWQVFDLEPTGEKVSWLEVEIRDVHPGINPKGQRIHDSGIAEIRVLGAR